ncbi:MAG: alpha/beta fold hydrolase, partial [Gemmatimonadetes bacterium]|nr:alpha/beta fold hydrolase [Gemmatimonadota bacterium]NIT87183.1 alpha/beta fold hydrolase [Gemmatimonadota bacterium]NIU77194.1 alpha/beta fold hydrolase [Gammaproteobacteria bacterium]NIY10620.1 alpha/beta fold hydrolase [Gemmatimonadota bacterium]NIY39380.1 alpha/beta fold hydrolase [Gemmatimonadota bacterium]
DVLALMDHHGIETAHLMGVSMGTIVVRTVAELAPERVRSLVLPGAIARLDTLARVLVALAHLAKRFVPHLWLYRFNAWIVLPLWGHP